MKKLLVCLAVSTVLFTGCSFMQKTGIIEVNGQVITKSDFNKAFDKSVDKSFLKSFGGAKNLPREEDNPMYQVFKEKVTNELIIKTLLDSEIEKRGIEATKEDVQNELKTVIDKVGSKEELNKILKERKISNEQFTNDLKTQIKIKKLVDSEEKIVVTDADAQKYYDTHKKEFTHGEQVRASHILVAANFLDLLQVIKQKNPDITPAELNAEIEKIMTSQKAKAEAILAEVKKNPDNFAKIAQQKSDDKGSAARGGELGFFPKDAMVKEFAEAAFALKPNTISDVVQTSFGYHIIKVTDRMEAGTTPFAKVKEDLKYYLETQKQIAVLKKLTTRLMKEADIKYIDPSFDPAKPINVNTETQADKPDEKTKK